MKKEKNAKQAKDHLVGNKQIILTRLTRRSKKEGKKRRRRFIRASWLLLWVNIPP